MRWMTVMAGLVAGVVAVLGATRARAAVMEGDCRENGGGTLATVMQAIDSTRPLPCLPKDDPRRAAIEQQELSEMERQYFQWVKTTCSQMRCLSNAWGRIADIRDPVDSGKHVMAGCGKWSSEGSTALASDPRRYWTLREVRFGRGGLVGDGFHWVVEVENTRTGQKVCFDGWNGAHQARSWAFWRPERARPWNLDRTATFREDGTLVASWGA